jgi:phosphopantetheinyl transferase
MIVFCNTLSLSKLQFEDALTLAQPADQARIMRYMFHADRISALVGHLVSRLSVAELNDVHASKVELARTLKGRVHVVRKEIMENFERILLL